MQVETTTLRLGFPKGSLQEACVVVFQQAGWRVSIDARSYKPRIDDPEIELRMLRAQEISRYVEDGFLDAGITGRDWIAENRSRVHVVQDLRFSKASSAPARWVLAVPEKSSIQKVSDLQGKRIATEAVNLTKDYLSRHGVSAHVEFSWGATEVKVPELVDAIVDITETGSSLRANNLRIVDVILESYPQLICNEVTWQNAWKRHKLETLALLLQAALDARDRVGIKLNCPREQLPALLEKLPALRKPTVNQLSDPDWVAVETVAEEHIVRELIPTLKKLGAEGIIEYPLNKLVF
jgi:ATP phosphoribosyltransferase